LKETTFVRSLGHTIHFMSTNAMYDGIRWNWGYTRRWIT
jgi:hypothetical protein